MHARYLTQTQEATAELSRPLLSSSFLILENKRDDSALLASHIGPEQNNRPAIFTDIAPRQNKENGKTQNYRFDILRHINLLCIIVLHKYGKIRPA